MLFETGCAFFDMYVFKRCPLDCGRELGKYFWILVSCEFLQYLPRYKSYQVEKSDLFAGVVQCLACWDGAPHAVEDSKGILFSERYTSVPLVAHKGFAKQRAPEA